MSVLLDLQVGLDANNYGVGRYRSDHFQDPTLFRPESGNLRSNLLRDLGEWYVLELCEPLSGLVDLGAEV